MSAELPKHVHSKRALVGAAESGYCPALALVFVVMTLIATTLGSVRLARTA